MSCRDSDTLIKDKWFLFVLSSQVFAAICSAAISLFAIKKCMILHFHVNCRILLITLLMLYFLHSICLTLLQASQVVRFILYDSCEATISSALCFGLRLPAGICVSSFAVLQLGMVLERAIALRRRQHYETSGATLGYVTAGSCEEEKEYPVEETVAGPPVIRARKSRRIREPRPNCEPLPPSVERYLEVVIGTVMATWSLMQMDLNTEVVYCSSSTAATLNRLRIRTFTQCVINLFALFCAGFVYHYNAAATRGRHFDLHSSYQLQENVDVIHVFIPLSIFQAICHLFFSFNAVVLLTIKTSNPTTTFQTILAASYIIPYYTLASPALLLLLLRWSSHKRTAKLAALSKTTNEHKIYFDAYAKMWAVTVPNKY